MDVQEANHRLACLHYTVEDAFVEAGAAPGRLRLRGSLVQEIETDADDLREILEMLPPKYDLLAYQVVANVDER